MSVNSSSPSNSSSLDPVLFDCIDSIDGILIINVFNITRAILILPLSIFVLCLGHQRWQQQRSFTTTSHSDIFTYHMAAMDLIWGLGSAFTWCGYSTDLPEMVKVGGWLSSITFLGETFFHILTCVERYLAVVHPIVYLGLRNARGVRIRNVSIGCVWLLCSVWSGVINLNQRTLSDFANKSFSSLLLFSLVVVSFFSVSILCVLNRPGPGDGGQDKERVDLSKKKAFITMMVILVMLWLWFVGFLAAIVLEFLLSPNASCVLVASAFWFSLPSSLVLPLLYLHRAGKLPCGCFNSE